MVNLVQNVEILRKTLCNSLRLSRAKLCAKIVQCKNNVENNIFPHTFSGQFTDFYTTKTSLFLSNLFHFCTHTITTTINNILIKNLNERV